ncbi:MAG: hypothetical protein QOD81_1113 [Solirubrobacteraceae bacterium]|nr:hypothetical protein [Solirubrobacteraceae bacterium]
MAFVTTTPDRPLESLRHRISARTQLVVSGIVGLIAGVAVGLPTDLAHAPLIAWDIAAGVYLAWVWATIAPMDAERTERLAEHQDPTRAAADVVLLSAAVVSLVAVGLLIARASQRTGAEQLALVLLALASVVLSWAVVHTVFTLRYARLYYTDPDGGVDFNQDKPPDYRDFAYLAFGIGMTCQVADTDLQSSEIRRTVLCHSLLAYLFGTGILAATINLVSSLAGGS